MTREEAADLYRQGLTMRQIGDRAGVTSQAVSLWLKALGVPARPRAKPKAPKQSTGRPPGPSRALEGFARVVPGETPPRAKRCTARPENAGTWAGYRDDGCRCWACTRASTLEHKARRYRDPEKVRAQTARTKERYLVELPCGDWLKYWAGCRCPDCTVASLMHGQLRRWKLTHRDIFDAVTSGAMTYEEGRAEAKRRAIEKRIATKALRSTSDA